MKTYYLHSTAKSGRRFTLAATVKDDNLLIGSALCSNKDQFCRRIGRNISEGRLNKFIRLEKDGLITFFRIKEIKQYHYPHFSVRGIKVSVPYTLHEYAKDFAELN